MVLLNLSLLLMLILNHQFPLLICNPSPIIPRAQKAERLGKGYGIAANTAAI
jgi:hypothetical protein